MEQTTKRARTTPIAEEAEDKSPQRFLLPDILLIEAADERQIFQLIAVIKIGRKIAAVTIIPYIPKTFLVSERQPLSETRASETALPTMGTAEPTRNFAVFETEASADDETRVPSPKIAEKTLIETVSTQTAKFLNDFATSPISTSETEPAIHIARKMQISGSTVSEAILPISEDAPSIKVRYPAAEEMFPAAATAEE